MSDSKARPPITNELLRRYEFNSVVIRERAGISRFVPFFPFNYLTSLRVKVRYLDEAQPDAALREMNAKDFSGGARELPNGILLAVLNRSQTQERKNVTLLEEISHRHYGHKPTYIGPLGRTHYNPADEQEAQFTAAAALLPAKIVAMGVYQKKNGGLLAASFGASEELYEQRVKTMGLWDLYEPLIGEKAA